MAEIYHTIINPEELSRRIRLGSKFNILDDSTTNNTTSNVVSNLDNDTTSNSGDAPSDVIDVIYRSMSKIIEALTTDNLLLNQQLKKVQSDLEFVCNTVAERKSENSNMIINNDLITQLNNDIVTLKNKNTDLQRQILDTRTLLLRTVNDNIKNIKKDIISIKITIADEVKKYMSNMPSLESKFEDLAREYRSKLSQHIRKSTVQRVNSLQNESSQFISAIQEQMSAINNTADIEQLKTEQREFISKMEKMFIQMKEKIDKLPNERSG